MKFTPIRAFCLLCQISVLTVFGVFLLGCRSVSWANREDPRLCKDDNRFASLRQSANPEIDGETILRNSLRKYQGLKEYNADVSIKSVTLVSILDWLFNSFRAEQRSQFVNVRYSETNGMSFDWKVFTPQVIDCSDSRLSRETCEMKRLKGRGKAWCTFITEDMFDPLNPQIKGEGIIDSDEDGVIVRSHSGGLQVRHLDTMGEGLNWLEGFSGMTVEIPRLVYGKNSSARLPNLPASKTELLGEDQIEGIDCYVLRLFAVSSASLISIGGSAQQGQDQNGLFFYIWVRKGDFLISKLETKSILDESLVVSTELHSRISFR